MSFMRTTKYQRRGIVKEHTTPTGVTTTEWKKFRRAQLRARGKRPQQSPMPFVASERDRALVGAMFG